MERALELEGARLLAVLQDAQRALELAAIIPFQLSLAESALGDETRRALGRHVRNLEELARKHDTYENV